MDGYSVTTTLKPDDWRAYQRAIQHRLNANSKPLRHFLLVIGLSFVVGIASAAIMQHASYELHIAEFLVGMVLAALTIVWRLRLAQRAARTLPNAVEPAGLLRREYRGKHYGIGKTLKRFPGRALPAAAAATRRTQAALASSASIAATSLGSSAATSGENRPTTLPLRSMRNFSKFHNTSVWLVGLMP